MYAESQEQTNVESWVTVVRKLRYKDYQLVAKPGIVTLDGEAPSVTGLWEVSSVKEFGEFMSKRGTNVFESWRKAMGYAAA
ncbi:hypothetical protein N7520_003341 [Penicillium odoratum]|uniref:uncharacterized protein n=1 Tax=Penicillium odoratum TaxID=1167516 RepID=UPI0025497019|nr:uncharacterized protein N7520_003341 [Penicillium odoratum]KAJ5768782.1 hypothetical protein N7520_003341 [Penicillium odoratum]